MALKLDFNFIPRTSAGKNLRYILNKSEWDNLRRQVYLAYDNSCDICGSFNIRLNCHEMWDWDYAVKVQKLIGLVSVCELCHKVIHFNQSSIRKMKGYSEAVLVAHFLRVNNCSMDSFELALAEALGELKKKEKICWKIDYRAFSSNEKEKDLGTERKDLLIEA